MLSRAAEATATTTSSQSQQHMRLTRNRISESVNRTLIAALWVLSLTAHAASGFGVRMSPLPEVFEEQTRDWIAENDDVFLQDEDEELDRIRREPDWTRMAKDLKEVFIWFTEVGDRRHISVFACAHVCRVVLGKGVLGTTRDLYSYSTAKPALRSSATKQLFAR